MLNFSTPFFSRPSLVLATAAIFRLILILYGHYQDNHSAIKYTDIDYLVFTDAARYVARGRSPYDRATYRYTPLLAWLLLPTTWSTRHLSNVVWIDFGKVVFAAGDCLTGWIVSKVLVRHHRMSVERSYRWASLWLLNPMVANISTRGSSEGLLAVVVVALVWSMLERRIRLAGALLGLGVHFKIYPFIYAASVWWWLGNAAGEGGGWKGRAERIFTKERVTLAWESFRVFSVLNMVMYYCYGVPFLQHTYTYHLIRTDHRHNFSVYNTLLHLNSAHGTDAAFRVESLAFFPQLFLAVGAIPYLLAEKDLAGTMLAQTFAFVIFNKVCTSQYFLWYMVFLPLYLPGSVLLRRPALGVSALLLWIVGQAVWLQQGYELEFLGKSTFFPGLCVAGDLFFLVNCWILGLVVSDVASRPGETARRASINEEKVQ